VAIRTAVIDKYTEKAEYGSGGGIVWDSSAEDEYTEALLKARVLTEKRPEFSLLETMLWMPEEGYFLLDYHMKRLMASSDYFGYPVQAGEVREQLIDRAKEFAGCPQRIRLMANARGELAIEAAELSETPEKPVHIRLAPEPVYSSNVFLYHKTTYRLVYEKALQSCPDCEDVLLWNERREVTESSIANVVVEMNGELLTPPLYSGLLAGTFRELLLEQGIIREQAILIDDLSRCSKIHLINSVRKWREAAIRS
jgi:para-aminobenzoate synthetase/4-amino-4-deoxychorismate lyase